MVVHYFCLIVTMIILGIVRRWYNWAARIIYPLFFLLKTALQIATVYSSKDSLLAQRM